MLALFFLLGIAWNQSLTTFSWNYLWAIFALASSFVAATSLNDIADKNIDQINHPSGIGRPLVSGIASIKDLYIVHAIAACVALCFAALIDQNAILILFISLLINYVYSMPPIKLSYRTHFAPLILTLAYVFIPLWLSKNITHSLFDKKDIAFTGMLLFLFVGRIILKDFRDKAGDAQYGKPTFLLSYGKNKTCLASLSFIVIGNIFFLYGGIIQSKLLLILLEFYFVLIYYALLMLRKTELYQEEQKAIGLGAKTGNGLLITLLGILILKEYAASSETLAVFALMLIVLYGISFTMLKQANTIIFQGYKG